MILIMFTKLPCSGFPIEKMLFDYAHLFYHDYSDSIHTLDRYVSTTVNIYLVSFNLRCNKILFIHIKHLCTVGMLHDAKNLHKGYTHEGHDRPLTMIKFVNFKLLL